MSSQFGLGPTGSCICPKCDHKISHRKGIPCQEEHCPQCGTKMIREHSEHHQLLKKKGRKEN